MIKTLAQPLQQFIQKQKNNNLYRQRLIHQQAQGVELLIDGKNYLSFCSNDYLGLANNNSAKQVLQQAVSQYGIGAGASHLVTGHQQAHQQLEQRLAEFTQRQAALLFSSGYMANIGVITALLGRYDAIFMDKLNHASLVDAALLSGAKVYRYRHLDSQHLAQLLNKSTAHQRLIVTDGVFSMDGDIAPLNDIARLAQQHQAWLMVDDAHGIGVLGQYGRGSLDHFQLDAEDVPILMGTLGKAIGGVGAFVAGDALLIDYLIQRARTHIYTTAQPAALATVMLHNLDLVEQADEKRQHLQQLIQIFKQLAYEFNLPILASDTPIQGLLLKQSDIALKVSQFLYQQGILVTAIRPPTVPVNTARLRITLSADHSIAQLTRLMRCLKQAMSS